MTTKANMMGAGCSALEAIATGGIPSTGLTAAGNSQGTALALTTDFNVFTTVASSTGCILPTQGPNYSITDTITVVNHGANALSVYPEVGGTVANGSLNAAFSVSASKTAMFTCIGSKNWAAAVSA
jgi:hypothetical protein